MIQYFKNIDGQTIEIQKADQGVWVNLVPPFKEEEFVDIPADMVEKANEYRQALMEAVAESDDELMMKYLEGEELT